MADLAQLKIENLAGLSKPLAKLVEVVAQGCGAVYEPTRIRRKAKADVDAAITHANGATKVAKILASASAELSAEIPLEMQERIARAYQRVSHRELRRQKNIEDIADKAAHQLPESVSDEKVDEDWIFQMFNYCQDVSDETIQNLWARVLAGEVAQPDSYSLNALHTISILDRAEAKAFEVFCDLVWSDRGGPAIAFLNDRVGHLFEKRGLDFTRRLNLESVGLLYADLGIFHELDLKQSPRLYEYGGSMFRLDKPSSGRVRLYCVPLTQVGKELYQLCDTEPDEEYREFVIEEWRDQGLEVQEVVQGKEAKAE